ncbi:MAG: CsgG/HfaB family protein [Syntrophaceae bacterium]
MPRDPFAKTVCLFLLFFLFSGCAHHIELKKIPEPSFSAKLRVLVLPVTASQPRTYWTLSDEEYSRLSYSMVSGILQQKGIYEVVPQADLARALGDQKVAGWQWTADNYSLAREAARAVRADYVFIVERGASTLMYWKMVLINRKTGKQYTAADHVSRKQDTESMRKEYQRDIKEAYREIFLLAKADLFETAVRRGKTAQHRAENGKSGGKKIQRQPETPVRDKPEIAKKSGDRHSGKTRLIVYDFDTVKHLEIASLILSDALREELQKNGRFVLINREDLNHIMDEIKLQKSGLVDEKRAVQLGNWLAANEIVTGKLAVLGSTYVLTVKRTDMGTMAALGIGSLKCPVGKEENLLAGIPDIARRVAGRP